MTNVIQTQTPEPPTRTSRIFNRVILACLIIAAIGIGVFLRWSFANTEVLKMNNLPFPVRVVSDPTSQTGGVVFLTADYCKNRKIDGQVRVSYISKSREIFLPLAPEKGEKGCKKIDVPIVIPKDLPKDTYKIKFRTTYDINPIKQNIITDFESQEFTLSAQ